MDGICVVVDANDGNGADARSCNVGIYVDGAFDGDRVTVECLVGEKLCCC